MEAIANNKAKPTFDNTIIALEKSGDILDRATTVFFSLVGADTNDTRKKLQADYSAKFAAHSDAIALNGKLFARIQALYDTRSQLGADASASGREVLRQLRARRRQAVRGRQGQAEGDERRTGQPGHQVQPERAVGSERLGDHRRRRQELDGLSKEQIAAAAEAAKARGLEGSA